MLFLFDPKYDYVYYRPVNNIIIITILGLFLFAMLMSHSAFAQAGSGRIAGTRSPIRQSSRSRLGCRSLTLWRPVDLRCDCGADAEARAPRN